MFELSRLHIPFVLVVCGCGTVALCEPFGCHSHFCLVLVGIVMASCLRLRVMSCGITGL